MIPTNFRDSLICLQRTAASLGIHKAMGHFVNENSLPAADEINRHPMLDNTILSGAGVPIQFVPSPSTRAKGFNTLYQPRIFLKGEVATRNGSWHDFFNALTWLCFPKVKAYINRRHFNIFDSSAEFPWTRNIEFRNREQDALTIFDEGGAIVLVRDSSLFEEYRQLNAIERKKWIQNNLEKDLKIFIFGHAIYEVLLEGHQDILASGIWLTAHNSIFSKKTDEQIEIADSMAFEWLSERQENLNTKNFTSVPVNVLY